MNAPTIAAGPFARWLQLQLDAGATTEQLAMRIGWPGKPGQRRLYRYVRQIKESFTDRHHGGERSMVTAEHYERATVIDALSAADVGLWELADITDADGQPVPGREEYDEDVELEPDAFCEHCHETVTPIDGKCPWCNRSTADVYGLEKRWCEREDRMVYPAGDGSCWRCGGPTQRGVPYAPCACGCGRMVHRFDRHGRAIRYVHGHAPRTCERDSLVAATPFAEYLRREVADVDALTAVALKHGLPREQLAALLRGDVDQVARELVRKGLWVAGRYGQAKGMPMRRVPSFFELYPNDRRARTCPGCGKGKAPHALLCKRCRTASDRATGRPATPRSITRLREQLIVEAYALYEQGGTLLDAAERIFERTPHTNITSTSHALRRAWHERGWPMRTTTRRAA